MTILNWLADTFLQRQAFRRVRELRARKPLFLAEVFYGPVRYRLQVIGEPDVPLDLLRCLLTIEMDGIHLYPLTRDMEIHIHFPPETLRWFGRPEKYHEGHNHIWLHFESGGQWQLLDLRTNIYSMQELVRALKQIATAEQIKAYRRQRPYIHLGPVDGEAAEQDLYGAWTVHPPLLKLYLMPIALVVLEGSHVQRVLPLNHVQQIEAIPRLDDPTAGGVVRFKLQSSDTASPEPETLAYTMIPYAEFGASLAEAAKRTLEEPPTFYGKKKSDEDWED